MDSPFFIDACLLSLLVAFLFGNDTQEFNIEHQRGVGRDVVVAAFAVGHVGGQQKDGLVTDVHLAEGYFPAGDHLMGAEGESEGLATFNGTVEYGAVQQFASVVVLSCLENWRSCPSL